jgi:hypothetical protein
VSIGDKVDWRIQVYPKLIEALREISKRKGRYSTDHLKHADNTIEDMAKVAVDALKEAGEALGPCFECRQASYCENYGHSGNTEGCLEESEK